MRREGWVTCLTANSPWVIAFANLVQLPDYALQRSGPVARANRLLAAGSVLAHAKCAIESYKKCDSIAYFARNLHSIFPTASLRTPPSACWLRSTLAVSSHTRRRGAERRRVPGAHRRRRSDRRDCAASAAEARRTRKVVERGSECMESISSLGKSILSRIPASIPETRQDCEGERHSSALPLFIGLSAP